MKKTLKNYLYKAGTLSMSGIMALSLCAPALSASANTKPAHHAKTVYFWDETPSQNTPKKKGHKRANHKKRANKKRTRKNTKKRTPKKRDPKRSMTKREKKEMQRKILDEDESILDNMDSQLGRMQKSLRRQKATHLHKIKAHRVYQSLRKHGYSYNQTIAILAEVNYNTGGSYMNVNSRSFGYFNLTGATKRAYFRYAKRTHQPSWNINTQLKFMNRGHRNFKKAKGTQYKLYQQFVDHIEGAHSYMKPSRKQSMHYIRLARNARK